MWFDVVHKKTTIFFHAPYPRRSKLLDFVYPSPSVQLVLDRRCSNRTVLSGVFYNMCRSYGAVRPEYPRVK